jgi:hypothetical protein
MGSTPIMNTDTMSKRATLALTSMAAAAEGRASEGPSRDMVATIDDVLGASIGMTFFGATTKPYKSPSDPNTGTFYTVPVKYDFESRDTRVRAEKILRANCKVRCDTPYPPILRECMKRVIADVKKDYPGCRVKVTVDANNFALRVARWHEKGGWFYAKEDIPLPKEALDIHSRRIPDSLFIPTAQLSPRKDDRRDSTGSLSSSVLMDSEVQSQSDEP